MMFKDKNLLIITTYYNHYVKYQVEEIATHFNNVYVFVRTKPIANFLYNIGIKKFWIHTTKIISNVDNLPRNIKIYDIPFFYLPINYFYKKLGDRHLRKVKKIILKEKLHFDLIHCHFIWSSGYVGTKIKEIYKKPLVITAHGSDIYRLPFKNNFWMEKITEILLNCDSLITVSNKNIYYIHQLGIYNNVFYIPNGYSERIFVNKRQINNSDSKIFKDTYTILSIGALIQQKGYQYLIESIKLLDNEIDLKCYIVGEGSFKSELNKMIYKYNLENKIIFLGSVSHKELSELINKVDIVVHPSLAEGNPTVMFETIGCGKPFIGSRVGGIPEIIINEDYGLIFEPGNITDLTEKIKTALFKKWDNKKIENYAQQFTWVNISKQILNKYKLLLE